MPEDLPLKIYRNEDVKSIIVGIPGPQHKHIRAVIQTDDQSIVFQEATLAALVRAYTSVKNHPSTRAVKLEGTYPEDLKPGYARWQLVDSGQPDHRVEKELERLLK